MADTREVMMQTTMTVRHSGEKTITGMADQGTEMMITTTAVHAAMTTKAIRSMARAAHEGSQHSPKSAL
jgi:hypothetical protein